MKYFGVTIVSSRNFKTSTEESRRAFHRAVNAIFGCSASAELLQKLCCNCCVVNDSNSAIWP